MIDETTESFEICALANKKTKHAIPPQDASPSVETEQSVCQPNPHKIQRNYTSTFGSASLKVGDPYSNKVTKPVNDVFHEKHRVPKVGSGQAIKHK